MDKKEILIGTIILFGLVSFSFYFFSTAPAGSSNLIESIGNEGFRDLFLGPGQRFSLESPDFVLVEKNSLTGQAPPTTFTPQVLGALVGGYETEDIKKIIVEYEVKEGDSLWQIASKFDITLETLLWANNLNKNSIIKAGQKLVIPPVSGVIHHVKAGDTVSEIAQKYKAKAEEIISFNNLSNEADIFVGDILVVPNGVMPAAPSPQYAPQWVPLADSYFICPIASPCRITQGLHWYNAVDFSHGNCGEPIYAAAGGQVLKVKLTNSTSRWAFGGAGNHITILHPNGVVTMYGHIATSFVNPGDQVSQGQIIALMGGQPGTPGAGKSTGCHLHFGVTGARNPFAK
jgi:LysM repeat protein